MLRWSAVVIALLFGIHFLINRTQKPKKSKHKSLIDSFVFRDKIKDRTTLAQKYSNVFENSLLLTDDDKINFVHFRQENIAHQTLPNPRSHVVTNSSHVIWKFVHQKGCVFNKRHGVIYQYLKVVFVCFESVNNLTRSKCRSWTWDPANWTLTLSNKEEVANLFGQYRVCAFPKLTDRVGKVVYPNGTEEYPGCAFNKSPCAVVEPYYDVDLRMRINWSPCCRRMMITMLSNAHDIFEKHRIRYVMTGGAVISVGRENGALIPYDTDLDLIVDIRDREKFSNQSATDMAKLGYYYIWNKRGKHVTMNIHGNINSTMVTNTKHRNVHYKGVNILVCCLCVRANGVKGMRIDKVGNWGERSL